MTTYSYAQLEGLWEAAGGSKALAPVMAAIAMAESGGDSAAYNPSGASGLWQILGAVNPADQPDLFNAQVNAKEAVLKYNTQGLAAWVTYTSGAYKKYLQGDVPPTTVTGGGSGTTSTTGGGTVATSDIFTSLGVGNVASAAQDLLKVIATVIDYSFGMFGRGQGARVAFAVAALIIGLAAWKTLSTAGVVPGPPTAIPVPV